MESNGVQTYFVAVIIVASLLYAFSVSTYEALRSSLLNLLRS